MAEIFVVRSPDVVHETIDGETVIIDMAQGTYYRLEGAAAQAWQRLSSGASAADLARHIEAHFEAPDGAIAGAVAAFLSELESYKLVERRADPPAAAPTPAPPPATRAPLGAFAIHRFTDLEELFLIDPVHEVDETGWPAPPPAQP